MPSDSKPKWYRRKRVLWPLAVVLLFMAAVGMALARARASRVILYNDTGRPIAELTVSACGQSRTFQDLGDGDSVRLTLAPRGGESDIAVATNGVVMWRGDYVEPQGGYRATIRLRPDNQIECSTTISCWEGWFHPSTALPNETR